MIRSLNCAAVAVTALKGFHHSGDCEGQQEKPDDDRDLRRFLEDFDEISPAKMYHIEVAIDGQCDEEGNTGTSVEEQHEEHHLTHTIILTAPHMVMVMVGLGRKTSHQQEISNHDIEQEDTFVLPELEPEDEDVEDRQVERQTEHELYNH